MLINRIKLAKALLKLAAIETDKGILTYEGELEVGTEVFVDKEGEIVAAEDGEYKTDVEVIVVKDGKVEAINPIEEPVEEPVEEPKEEEPIEKVEEAEEESVDEPDEKDLRIKELEDLVAERDAIIEELTQKLKELEEANKVNEEKLSKSAAKPAFESFKTADVNALGNARKNKALRYFEK